MFIKQFNIRLRNLCLISILLAKSFNLIPMLKKSTEFFQSVRIFSYSVCTDFRESHLGTLAGNGIYNPGIKGRTVTLTTMSSLIKQILLFCMYIILLGYAVNFFPIFTALVLQKWWEKFRSCMHGESEHVEQFKKKNLLNLQ